MKMTKIAVLVTWAVIAASFALSAQTWIDLARMAGFRQIVLDRVALAWAMPISVDGYVLMSLLLWLGVKDAKMSGFAKKNTYVAALFGVLAQSVYHGLSVGQDTHMPWFAQPIAFVVGALPPGFAALSVHMLALMVNAGHVRVRSAHQRWTPSGQTGGITVRTPSGHLSGQRTADSEVSGQRTPVRTADSGQTTDVSGQRTPVRTPSGHLSGQRTADSEVSGQRTPVRTADSEVSGQRTPVRTADSGQTTDVSGQRTPVRTADIEASGQRTPSGHLSGQRTGASDTVSGQRTADSGHRVIDLVTGQPVIDLAQTAPVRTAGGQRADIIDYLSGHPDTSAKTLADMFGVDVRTARRYRARMSGQTEGTEQ